MGHSVTFSISRMAIDRIFRVFAHSLFSNDGLSGDSDLENQGKKNGFPGKISCTERYKIKTNSPLYPRIMRTKGMGT
jgi:hypothetical protein